MFTCRLSSGGTFVILVIGLVLFFIVCSTRYCRRFFSTLGYILSSLSVFCLRVSGDGRSGCWLSLSLMFLLCRLLFFNAVVPNYRRSFNCCRSGHVWAFVPLSCRVALPQQAACGTDFESSGFNLGLKELRLMPLTVRSANPHGCCYDRSTYVTLNILRSYLNNTTDIASSTRRGGSRCAQR